MTTDSMAAIVMAAGQSRRYGSDKRLALLPGGRSLLQATVALAARHFGSVILVLGPDDQSLELTLPSTITLVHAPDTHIGLGTSIASGFRHLLNTRCAVQSAAVLLGDMPWIKGATVERLIQHARASNIVRPIHCSQPGHPVFFGSTFWEGLSNLSGDEGAKAVIAANREKCELIAVEDGGVLLDVDRPEDLFSGLQRF